MLRALGAAVAVVLVISIEIIALTDVDQDGCFQVTGWEQGSGEAPLSAMVCPR